MGIKDSERKKKDRKAFVNRERINLFQQAMCSQRRLLKNV